ncbi:unnamed protein product [Spodoptera exigua]|nr:unnamed protein product [Spodoptera exigua]
MNKLKQETDDKAQLKKRKKKKHNVNKQKRNYESGRVSSGLVAALKALRLDGKSKAKAKTKKKKSKKSKPKAVVPDDVASTSDQPTSQKTHDHYSNLEIAMSQADRRRQMEIFKNLLSRGFNRCSAPTDLSVMFIAYSTQEY